MGEMTRRALMGAGAAAGLASWTPAEAQPVTTDQDHRNMLDQLGIRALRPGRSADETGPNPANYDEAKAGPEGELPDPLRLKDGRAVTSAEAWWKQRRPQIVQDFEREVYGRIPENVPKVTWTETAREREMLGFTPVVARQVTGRVDNSAHPAIEVNIQMTVVTPANAKRPVPLLIMFGRSAWPAPRQPTREQLARINAALKALMVEKDPGLAEVFAGLPAYQPVPEVLFSFPQGGPPPSWQLVAGGWGYAMLDTATIQADNGEGLTRGIIGLTNRGRPRTPEQWGALRAWGWGASRALDHLLTDPTIDPKRIGVEGVSRWGKAAMVTAAFDERFAMVLAGSPGKGGATLHRRNFGEAVENLTGAGGYHWMAGNYLKYGAEAGRSGRMDARDLPVDSHELIALVAPRPFFLSYGVPEAGDAKWLDQRGSWMAAVAAGRVYRLLGARDLGVGDDWRNTPMPPVLAGPVGGELAWRQHDGGHTDAPNIRSFMAWADGLAANRPSS